MRKFLSAAAALAMTLSMSTPAFAGWEQDNMGWRYMTGKDTYLTSQYTSDGYWVDVNGYWDGKGSAQTAQQAGGQAGEADTLSSQYRVMGNRIFKVTNAVLDGEGKNYTATVDLYDTAFMTNDEIKRIKKGDSFVLPGLNITVTAQNKASRGVIRTSSSKTDMASPSAKQGEKNGYRVRLADSAGNQYILSASRLRKTSADASVTETVLRPVATGITLVVPAWRDANRVNGTSSYSSTKSIMEKKKMFEGVLKGNEVVQITDTTYNYDTTTTPVYGEDAAHGHLDNRNEY